MLDIDLKTGVNTLKLTLTELSKLSNFAAKSRDPYAPSHTPEYQRRGIGTKRPLMQPGFYSFFCHFHGKKLSYFKLLIKFKRMVRQFVTHIRFKKNIFTFRHHGVKPF